MRCKKCGAQLSDNSRFCVYCGTEVTKINTGNVANQSMGTVNQRSYHSQPQQPNNWNVRQQASNQPNSWNVQQQTPNQQNNWNMQQIPNQQNNWNVQQNNMNGNASVPMAWHRFVVYVQYILILLVVLANAVGYFSGIIYAKSSNGLTDGIDPFEVAHLVYGFYPQLRTLDIIMGIAMIGLGVYCLWVRMRMVKFKVNAWKHYCLFCICSMVVNIIYHIASTTIVSNAMGGSYLSDDVSVYVIEFIGMIVYLVLNVIYYKKRAHLFVN